MRKKHFQKWTFSYAAIGGFIGINLGQIIQGELNLSGILGALTATVLIISIDVIRNWRKKDKTPEFDERTLRNMVKFYAYFSNIFIGILFLLLATITSIGIAEIPIMYLWIIIFIYFITSGAGAMFVSRK